MREKTVDKMKKRDIIGDRNKRRRRSVPQRGGRVETAGRRAGVPS